MTSKLTPKLPLCEQFFTAKAALPEFDQRFAACGGFQRERIDHWQFIVRDLYIVMPLPKQAPSRRVVRRKHVVIAGASAAVARESHTTEKLNR